MNSTYLQGHLVRRHPEHVHYIGDAVAHTKVLLIIGANEPLPMLNLAGDPTT